jgi:hypothetical protein
MFSTGTAEIGLWIALWNSSAEILLISFDAQAPTKSELAFLSKGGT